MSENLHAPIFIHSLWRSGSTYLFQIFRRSTAGYYCYQEPIHELAFLSKDNPQELLRYHGEMMKPLRHPDLDQPYFKELYDVYSCWFNLIEKSFGYDEYFARECSPGLVAYLTALLDGATGTPLIQECRTSSRIKAIQSVVAGTHLYLWRNPWDQWWSLKSTQYFDNAIQMVVNSVQAPPAIIKLRQEIGFEEFHDADILNEFNFFESRRLSAENSYRAFYSLWCLALIEAQDHADVLINIDQLSETLDYRKNTLNVLKQHGIDGIDFSDCHVHCTQFTVRDEAFFKPLEEAVYGILATVGIPVTAIDLIRSSRAKSLPDGQRVLRDATSFNNALEDAIRAREVVLRTETTAQWRVMNQIRLSCEREDILRLENVNLQLTSANRVNELTEQLISVRQAAELDKYEMVKSHSEQLLTSIQEFNRREDVLRHENENLQQLFASREKEFGDQLLGAQQVAEQEKNELLKVHEEQMQTMLQDGMLRENGLQRDRENLLQKLAIRENELNTQMLNANHDKNELISKFSEQLHEQEQTFFDALQTIKQQQKQFEQAKSVTEKQLKDQFISEHLHTISLQQSITLLQCELDRIRSSLSWKLTFPLRWCIPNRVSLAPEALSKSIDMVDSQQFCQNNEVSLTHKVSNPDTNEAAIMVDSRKELLSTFILSSEGVYTISSFLRYYDSDFIYIAYHAVLKREPDPEGESYYLARIREGVSKEQILIQMMKSPEAKAKRVIIKGLTSYGVVNGLMQVPILGILFSLVLFAISIREHLKELRAMENSLYRVSRATRMSRQKEDTL